MRGIFRDGEERAVNVPAAPDTGVTFINLAIDMGAFESSLGCGLAENYCIAAPNSVGPGARIVSQSRDGEIRSREASSSSRSD